MRNTLTLGSVLLVALSVGVYSDGQCANFHGADGTCCPQCPEHECVFKPGTKTIKKTVYDVKCVPVCEHQPAKFLAHCDCCPVCKLKYKRVLTKREVVTEVCITTCVPVEIPCGHCPSLQDKAPTPVQTATVP